VRLLLCLYGRQVKVTPEGQQQPRHSIKHNPSRFFAVANLPRCTKRGTRPIVGAYTPGAWAIDGPDADQRILSQNTEENLRCVNRVSYPQIICQIVAGHDCAMLSCCHCLTEQALALVACAACRQLKLSHHMLGIDSLLGVLPAGPA
jgi:hypothetical protein